MEVVEEKDASDLQSTWIVFIADWRCGGGIEIGGGESGSNGEIGMEGRVNTLFR